jgi:hypothetical protein
MVKIKAIKDIIIRKSEPSFSYHFRNGEIKEIPEGHWKYMKNASYLEVIKEKREK